jgi:hypothetical protein
MRSLDQHKLDATLLDVENGGPLENTFCLLFQETWGWQQKRNGSSRGRRTDDDENRRCPLHTPEGWIVFTADKTVTRTKESGKLSLSRGLATLVNKKTLQHLGLEAKIVMDKQTHSYDILAIRIGRCILVNTYVPCRVWDRGELVATIQDLRETPDDVLLVAGDFNNPDRWGHLIDSFLEINLHPLLDDPNSEECWTRESFVLDNIFLDIERWEEEGARIDVTIVETLAASSDHKAVSAYLPLTGFKRRSWVDLPPPTALIRWDKLQVKGEEGKKRDAAFCTYFQQHLTRDMDLEEINTALLKGAIEILGKRTPRANLRHPYMSDRTVRLAYKRLQLCRKRLTRHKVDRVDSETREVSRLAVAAARRDFRKERKKAMVAAKLDSLRKLANDPGDTQFWKAMRRTSRGRSGASCPVPPNEAEEHFRLLYRELDRLREEGESIMDRLAGTVEMGIDCDLLEEAITKLGATTPGPDGLDIKLLKKYKKELAATLAPAFTKALTHVPEALRTALVILLPKKDPNSREAKLWRGITLQPFLVRLLHKTVELAMWKKWGVDGPPILPVNAAFQTKRGGHEPAFLLLLLQAICQESKQPLVGAFLDMSKCWDSISTTKLACMVEEMGVDKDIPKILLNLLLGNTITILGRKVGIGRGLPQGSPLSCLLGLLFINSLALRLRAHLKKHPEYVIRLPSTHWATTHRDMAIILTLLLFADDVTILAQTPAALRSFCDVAAKWADDVGMEWSPKSFLVELASGPTPAGEESWTSMPTIRVGTHIPKLKWAAPPLGSPTAAYNSSSSSNSNDSTNNSSREGEKNSKLSAQEREKKRVAAAKIEREKYAGYLGYLVPTTSTQSGAKKKGRWKVPLDEEMVKKMLGTIKDQFWWKRSTYIIFTPTLTRAINAKVYASALYCAGLECTDYERLDKLVIKTVKCMYNLPITTPTDFIRWEMGLVHTEILGWKRTLSMAWTLFFSSIIGEHILTPSILRLAREHKPLHSVAAVGPLGRIWEALKRLYIDRLRVGAITQPHQGISPPLQGVDDATTHLQQLLQTEDKKQWESIVKAAAHRAFVTTLRKYGEGSRTLTTQQQRQLRLSLNLPKDDDSSSEEGVRFAPATPRRYHTLGGVLAVAGMRFRALSLSHQERGTDREACVWCDMEDSEHGMHLISCRFQPTEIRTSRDAAINAICKEGIEKTLTEARMCLYYLEWEGMTEETTRQALRYMRDAIRAYCKDARKRCYGDPFYAQSRWADPPHSIPHFPDDGEGPRDKGLVNRNYPCTFLCPEARELWLLVAEPEESFYASAKPKEMAPHS